MDHDSADAIATRSRHYAIAIDECRTTAQVVPLYADALRTYGPDLMDWRILNGAILRRWSASTLERIKREAWKTIKTKEPQP